jgi:hypothetical protein
MCAILGQKDEVFELGNLPETYKVKKYSFNITFLAVFGDKIELSTKFDP